MSLHLLLSILCFLHPINALLSQTTPSPLKTFAKKYSANTEAGYEVNFPNVDVKELIKFISQIADINFIYNEQDLDFNITFTSEEPTSLFNIMSAFTQILSIHGLYIIEDENNFIIHKNQSIKQIPPIVSEKTPLGPGEDPLIITRVFNIHNANPATLRSIISPMLSSLSLMTVSDDTRQVIITDTRSNIAQIAELISILDSPKTNLDVGIYKSKEADALQLTPLLNEIIMPISEGNPVIVVPQKETNTVFIVSTPYLINKAKEILRNLDTYSSVQDRILGADNILIYKLKYKTPEAVEKILTHISDNAHDQGFLVSGILESLKNVTYVKPTHSLLFIGDANSLARIKSLLDTIDIPSKPHESAENAKFYLYEPQAKSAVEIMSYLKEVEAQLKDSHLADPNLLQTLGSMRIIKDANTIVFTGDNASISEVQNLLKTLDLSEFNSKDEYLIYTPVNLSPQTLIDSMHQVADRLDKAGLVDEGFITAIRDAKYATYSHAIIFTGSKQTITKIKGLMNELDHTDKRNLSDQNMLIYQLKFASRGTVEKALDKFADSLPLESPVHEAIESASWMPEANSLVFRGTQPALSKIKEILALADTSDYAEDNLLTYRVKYAPYDQLKKDLDVYASQLASDDPTYKTIREAKWIPESKIFIFKGSPTAIKKVTELLTIADGQDATASQDAQQGYFIYNLQSAPGSIVMEELKKIKKRLENDQEDNSSLIQTISQIEYIPTTNSLFISGPQADIEQIKKFVEKFDSPQKTNVYAMVQLKYVNGETLLKELSNMTNQLSKKSYETAAISQVIDQIEYVKGSNSLFISGPAKAVEEVQKIIAGIDVPDRKDYDQRSQFLVYQPQNLSHSELQKSIDKLAKDLKETKLSDPILIESLEEAKYNSDSNTFVFTANSATLARIKELLQTIDLDRSANFFIYKPTNLPTEDFENAINNVRKELQKSNYPDTVLISSLDSMRYVKSSRSFLFTGNKTTLERIKVLLKNIDVPVTANNKSTNFLIYQPKHVPIKEMESSLQRINTDLKHSDFADEDLLLTLKSMRSIAQSNTLLFTGPPASLDKVKELLDKIDVESYYVPGSPNTHFLIYKPPNASTMQVKEAMEHITKDLQDSGLSDPKLSLTLASMRYVKSTDSLLFTGSEESLDKVKSLLDKVNLEISKKEGIQHVGKTTYLIYKIKESSPEHIEASLRTLVKDLKRGGNPNEALIHTIEDMRYVKDSHSIIFTGTEPTLKKVQELVIQFDTGNAGKKRLAPETFVLYQPKRVPGPELIHLVSDFEQNLVNSGVQNPELSDTINNLKWMSKTGQILVSGQESATDKVVALLEKFDNPDLSPSTADHGIETLDNTSFLIYKLQFHQGNDIQDVMQGIAADLRKNPSNKASEDLVKVIESIQWLKVTNSFIATGDPKTLERLKELLESVDTPLKQVFIEVLVIETTLTGRLEFGLRWGGQGSYKDRMAFSGANVPLSDDAANFSTLLPQVDASNPPLGTNMPIIGGGSMGVIGDLIFHKGQTYVALGDFINAVQQDSDDLIVLNQKMIAQDNQNSTLFVGENVPYNGSVVTNRGDTTTISANLEYRDIGIRLSITPRIGEDDIVSLDIDQSITEEITTGSSSGQTDTVYGIKTRKTTMKTKVHVPDKHFVAISGQIRNSTSRVKTAVPCLGGLPIIGAAFTTSDDTKNKSNVIMFLRPVIVNTYEEYKKLTERQEDIYREQSIAEDFDQAIELVEDVGEE